MRKIKIIALVTHRKLSLSLSLSSLLSLSLSPYLIRRNSVCDSRAEMIRVSLVRQIKIRGWLESRRGRGDVPCAVRDRAAGAHGELVYGTRCSATKEKGGRAKEDDRETYNCSPMLGEQSLVDEPCWAARDSARHTRMRAHARHCPAYRVSRVFHFGTRVIRWWSRHWVFLFARCRFWMNVPRFFRQLEQCIGNSGGVFSATRDGKIFYTQGRKSWIVGRMIVATICQVYVKLQRGTTSVQSLIPETRGSYDILHRFVCKKGRKILQTSCRFPVEKSS